MFLLFAIVSVAGMVTTSGSLYAQLVKKNPAPSATQPIKRSGTNPAPSATQPITGTLNGHDYVDLGLPSGTLWATCNVGATTPEGYGNYYAWGETTPKEKYNWDNYKYCNGGISKLTKYCQDPSQGNDGFTDNLTTLEACDDAATANWGAGWRMPTKDEVNELLDKCSKNIGTTRNGVKGTLFTGPNGNTIFLPAAGYYHLIHSFNGAVGLYWTSTTVYKGTVMFFTDDGYSRYVSTNRSHGLSVRPVCASTKN